MSRLLKSRTAAVATLTLTVVAVLLGASSLTSSEGDSRRSARFSDRSLHGSYALVGVGGAHEAASVGITRFDGRGRLSRTLVLNEPNPNGDGRLLVTIPGRGRYSVDADGSGTAEIVNELPDGATVRFTFDFVITDAKKGGAGRSFLGLALHMVQREPGIAATLVTFDLTRLPD